MPSKAESKSIKAEIRGLKTTLKANQKTTQRDISAARRIARTAAAAITTLESGLGRFERETATRIAILEGRLNS